MTNIPPKQTEQQLTGVPQDFAVIYVCDLDRVPDFNQMYELYDPMTIMFFYRNKHMMCDFGTGNNNKLNWVLEDKQELIDIIETIYKGAKKGRGLVVSPKGTSDLRLVIDIPFANSQLLQITRPGTDTKHCLPRRVITLAPASVCIASLRHLRRSLDMIWQQ